MDKRIKLFNSFAVEYAILSGRELIVAFIILSIGIITFNYADVFLAKALYLDDYNRFTLGLENKIHQIIYLRNKARAYVIFPLFKLLSINIVWARLALVIFFYIPLSLTFYYIIRVYAKVPAVVALFSSLIPCILPGQLQIPYFVDGSYTVQGLLVFAWFLIVAYKFILKEKFNWTLFIGSIGLFLFSIEMMDQSVFLLPFSIVSFIFISDLRLKFKRIIFLSFINLLLVLKKITETLNHPSGPVAVPIQPSIELFLERFKDFFHTVLPFSYTYNSQINESVVIGSLFLIIALCGFYFSGRKERMLIVLSIIWIFSSAIVFLTVSRYYSARYTHISSFGVNFIIVLSFWVFFDKLKKIPKRHTILIILLSTITLFSGVNHYKNINVIIKPLNKVHMSIVEDLSKYDFPFYSQIVIVNGHRIPTGGWWTYSSGYMKFSTQRNDVSGLIGKEKGFYDPFGIEKRGFEYAFQMSGLDLDKPTFLFKQNCARKCVLTQKEYALQWSIDYWYLYQFELDTGLLINSYKGVKYSNYLEFINTLNLKTDDIIFSTGSPKK